MTKQNMATNIQYILLLSGVFEEIDLVYFSTYKCIEISRFAVK